MMRSKPSLTVMPHSRRRRKSGFWLVLFLVVVACFIATFALTDGQGNRKTGFMSLYGSVDAAQKPAT